MATNKGKAFEVKFKSDFSKIEGSTIDRIYDSVSGYKNIRNVCDFIAYVYPRIYYMECKSHKGNTFPLTNLKQYPDLLRKKGIKGVVAGAIIWFIERDKVIFVPIETFEQLFAEGKKSVNVKMIGDPNYKILEIPSTKKRTFMDSDYSVLLDFE